MRVLFTARHSLSHLLSMAPVATACVTAGHDVRVAGPPGKAALVLPTGLDALPPGRGWCPDLVVRAEHGGVPDIPPTARLVHWSALSHRDTARHRNGSAAGELHVDPCPPGLRTAAESGALSVSHPDSPAVRVPTWLEQPPERLRVCLRPGLAPGTDGWSVQRVRTVAHAARGLGIELVAVLSPTARIRYQPALGHEVRLAGQQLLGQVLATCAGAIHEGGPDVTLAAAAHGLPQLVLAEQRPPGDRLGRIGAGRRLVTSQDIQDVTDPLRLRRHLAELLYGGRALPAAHRLRTEITALPSPGALVSQFEALVATRPGPR